MTRQTRDLEILDEDGAVLVINKPAGLLVIPDRWDPARATLVARAQAYLRDQEEARGDAGRDAPRVWIVHRLDRGTSGALVLAKTAQAHAVLSQQFERGEVEKSYLGLVRGHVGRQEGVIELPIGPHPHRPGLMAIRRRRGKPAVTRYKVLERFRVFTLLDIEPVTGRTHQIRVHLRAIGHPLAVDPLYGGGDAVYLSALKPAYRQKAGEEERPLIDRLTLHARSLRLTHPSRGERVEWTAPLPKDFAAGLRNLRRYQRLPGEPPPPPPASRGKEETM